MLAHRVEVMGPLLLTLGFLHTLVGIAPSFALEGEFRTSLFWFCLLLFIPSVLSHGAHSKPSYR